MFLLSSPDIWTVTVLNPSYKLQCFNLLRLQALRTGVFVKPNLAKPPRSTRPPFSPIPTTRTLFAIYLALSPNAPVIGNTIYVWGRRTSLVRLLFFRLRRAYTRHDFSTSSHHIQATAFKVSLTRALPYNSQVHFAVPNASILPPFRPLNPKSPPTLDSLHHGRPVTRHIQRDGRQR